MTAKVSPIECSRCTPSAAPRASGPDSPPIGGRHRDGAGADDQLVVAEQLLAVPSAVVISSLRPGTSIRRAVVSSRSRIPAASRSAMVRWARLLPVGDLAGDVVGDAADREVRVGVRHDHRDVRSRGRARGPAARR